MAFDAPAKPRPSRSIAFINASDFPFCLESSFTSLKSAAFRLLPPSLFTPSTSKIASLKNCLNNPTKQSLLPIVVNMTSRDAQVTEPQIVFSEKVNAGPPVHTEDKGRQLANYDWAKKCTQ